MRDFMLCTFFIEVTNTIDMLLLLESRAYFPGGQDLRGCIATGAVGRLCRSKLRHGGLGGCTK